MRRLLPTLSSFALTSAALVVLAQPGFAADQHASVHLAQIEANLQARLDTVPTTPLTGNEKKCRKAIGRARGILAADTATRAEDLKALKKVAGALNRWFSRDADLTQVTEGAASGYRAEVSDGADGVAAIVDQIQSQKDLKRVQKFLAKTRKLLVKADTARNPKQRAARLLKAQKQLVKAEDVIEDLVLTPSDDADFFIVVDASVGDGSDQLYRLDISLEDPSLSTSSPLSSGTGDVRNPRVADEVDEDLILFLQDEELLVVEPFGADDEPDEFSDSAPPLDPDDGFFVSPDGNYALCVDTDDDWYAITLSTKETQSLGNGVGPAVWSPTSEFFVLPGRETTPFFGTRFDVWERDGDQFVRTPLTGPSVDGRSGFDCSISTGGRYIAFSYIFETAPGTRLCILDRATGETEEVLDSIVAMRPGPDFRAPDIPVAWLNETQCVADGVPETFLITIDPQATEDAFDLDVIDESGGNLTVCVATDDDFICFDSQDEECVCYDVDSGETTLIDTGGATACSYVPDDRTLYFAKTVDAPELWRVDCATGEEQFLGTFETDPTKFATTFPRDCVAQLLGEEHVLCTTNVVGNNDATAGVIAFVMERAASAAPVVGGKRTVIAQESETTIDAYVASLSELTGSTVTLVVAAKQRSFAPSGTSLVIGAGEFDLEKLGEPVEFGPEAGLPAPLDAFNLNTVLLVGYPSQNE